MRCNGASMPKMGSCTFGTVKSKGVLRTLIATDGKGKREPEGKDDGSARRLSGVENGTGALAEPHVPVHHPSTSTSTATSFSTRYQTGCGCRGAANYWR